MSAGYKIFNDSIHGYIRLHPVCAKIIDTPEFQRLRNLKQLGTVYFVYPGASHNRFEHSLGVCHLAGKMVEALRRNSNEKCLISDEEKLCLEVAGLCHDLGHGPFSHTWERFVEAARSNDDTPVKWRHEESSVQMFEYLLEQNGLRSMVVEFFPVMKDKAIDLIKDLIKGEGRVMSDKKYLYQIISNKENGIDVDRWDYILRDSRHLNLSFSFDYSRLLQFCRVVDVDGEKIICFRNKDRDNIYDMFQFRVNLYHKACYHNVVLTVEEMIIDAFIEADRRGYKIQGYPLSEAHSHADALSRMTDHIFYDILYSTNTDFEDARKLLHRILQRDLYKVVACRNYSTELLKTKESLKEEESNIGEIVSKEKIRYKKCIEADMEQMSKYLKHCKTEHFKVLMILYDMGVEIKGASASTKGKINPFSKIYFYEKNNLEVAKEMDWEDIPVLPVPKQSMCHIHGLVIYKDAKNPVSKNKALQEELQDFKTELNKRWQCESIAAKKLKLM